ncbi:MAG: hypothetical protein ACOYWZ_12770 [Bacillota bacterium]
MPKIRPKKPETDTAKGGGWGDSKAKAGIWFYEKQKFRVRQKKVIEELKKKVGYLNIEDAIMVVDPLIEGIAVVAPNPSLPGIIILADGPTQEKSCELQERVRSIVSEIMNDLDIKGVE